ncbi:solute carrier family 22 member 7-like [Amblyomma americanum]
MAKSPSAGGSSQQVSSLLLTGFTTTDQRNAIQENVYVILGHGGFQRRVLFTGMLSVVVLLQHALANWLFARDVSHWCAPPPDLLDIPTDVWRNVAIPLGADGKPSSCDVYDPPFPPEEADEDRRVVRCRRWQYDAVHRGNSIMSRWDLVCDQAWLLTVSKAAYMLGATLFVPLAGLASDKVGRRPAILFSVTALLAFCIGCSGSQTFAMFLVTRFFVSASSCSLQVLIFILLYEVTGSDRRALYGVLDTAVGTTVVAPTLHLLSRLQPRWELAHMILILPTAVLALWCYLLEESPSWLLAVWNTRAAERVILIIAEQNGVDLVKARATFQALKQQIKKQTPQVTTTSGSDSIVPGTFARRAFSVVLCWFSVNFTYYGLVLRNVDSGDIWRAVHVVLQVLLYAAIWRFLQSRGQRETFSIMLGLLCTLMTFQASVQFAGATPLFALADAAVQCVSSATLSVNYGYTAEVFPTVIRSVGLSISYSAGRLGVLAVGTLMAFTDRGSAVYINLLMTILILLSAAAIQWLPEIFVEKRKQVVTPADMTEKQRKAVIQASLSPTATSPARERRRSPRRARKAKSPVKSPSKSVVRSPAMSPLALSPAETVSPATAGKASRQTKSRSDQMAVG